MQPPRPKARDQGAAVSESRSWWVRAVALADNRHGRPTELDGMRSLGTACIRRKVEHTEPVHSGPDAPTESQCRRGASQAPSERRSRWRKDKGGSSVLSKHSRLIGRCLVDEA